MSRVSRLVPPGGVTSTAGKVQKSAKQRERKAKADLKARVEQQAEEKRRSSALVKNILNSEAVTSDELLSISPADKRSARYLARILFVSGAATIPVIARELGISEAQVRNWHGIDRWAPLRKQVFRLASKETIRQNRLAMGRYVRNIDEQLNAVIDAMGTRLSAAKPVETEESATRLKLEALRLKIALLRTLSHGTGSRTFVPSPETATFAGTESSAPTSLFAGGLLPTSNVSVMLDAIPDYMKAAARFVLGIDPQADISDDMVAALVHMIDSSEKSTESLEEENAVFSPLEGEEEEEDEPVMDILLEG